MTESTRAKAILILSGEFADHLSEALAIADSANYDVVSTIIRRKSGRRISSEFAERIKKEAEAKGADTLIYYGYLEPSSVYKLEKVTRLKVLDRVMIILEIFALHAGSKEAKLQIEMARLKHELPLIREYIRRTKLGEQVDFLGPGRYAFEAYEKYITARIARIRRELEELKQRVKQQELARKGLGLTLVSIVGYASAGKTSIFNAITGDSQPTGPEYFTTLTAKHKLVNFKGSRLLLIDTVGFVRDVPPEIIESFYSTLQEAALADALILVVDSSEHIDTIVEKTRAGLEILMKLNAAMKPLVVALNKVDLVDPSELAAKELAVQKTLLSLGIKAPIVRVSAIKKVNLDQLLRRVVELAAPKLGGPSEALRQGVRAEARS